MCLDQGKRPDVRTQDHMLDTRPTTSERDEIGPGRYEVATEPAASMIRASAADDDG
ncbi:hypothetical protein GCM10010472_37370 [Pseudonocardia halophobica]|uniref:Uncharacterized protein n=1 Tax=Pseudonocardia halophobica TaxID=29401 RepID=A0A9W6L6B7_9PSEU|nr:hypothetical protein GCM10017577_52090 [Pseudonocardia halophobica]